MGRVLPGDVPGAVFHLRVVEDAEIRWGYGFALRERHGGRVAGLALHAEVEGVCADLGLWDDIISIVVSPKPGLVGALTAGPVTGGKGAIKAICICRTILHRIENGLHRGSSG